MERVRTDGHAERLRREREKRAFERLPRVSWASRGHAPQNGGKSAGRRRDASLCPPAGVIHHLNAGGNLWLQFSAFIAAALGLGKHAAPAVTPSRRRHIVPLIGPPPRASAEGPPARDGVTNERRAGCKWNVSAAAFMVIGNIKHESQAA